MKTLTITWQAQHGLSTLPHTLAEWSPGHAHDWIVHQTMGIVPLYLPRSQPHYNIPSGPTTYLLALALIAALRRRRSPQ